MGGALREELESTTVDPGSDERRDGDDGGLEECATVHDFPRETRKDTPRAIAGESTAESCGALPTSAPSSSARGASPGSGFCSAAGVARPRRDLTVAAH